MRMRWSSGSVGLTGSCRTADRKRRQGVVARAGSVALAGWSASGNGAVVGALHQVLGQVAVPLRVEVRDHLFSQLADLDLKSFEQGRRGFCVAVGQGFGALTKPIQQHLTIAHRAKSRGEPAQL